MGDDPTLDRERLSVPNTASSIATARDFVRTSLAEAAPGAIDDIVLVTSELVTNSVEHGEGAEVEVATWITPNDVIVSVASDSSALPAPASGHAPVDDLTGRGLRIVSALSDEVAVIGQGSAVRVECRFRRR
ncbi:MAG: ATP-binding protein [Ilumatobacter sp.]|nr:ATP-binding protein [Ilumatobacter sp.]